MGNHRDQIEQRDTLVSPNLKRMVNVTIDYRLVDQSFLFSTKREEQMYLPSRTIKM